MDLFSRWRDRVLDFEGVTVAFRLRAADVEAGKEIQRKVVTWRRESLRVITAQIKYVRGEEDGEPEDSFALFERVFGTEWARRTFERSVRLKDPIQDDEGKAIEGGGALFDLMGLGERVAILLALDSLTFLQASEGKASGSPSTSSVAGGPTSSGSSSSAATSTAGEASPPA